MYCQFELYNRIHFSGAVRVGILSYSTEVEVHFHLNSYSTKADVFNAIDKIPYAYGSTNTAGALMTLHSVMFTSANGDREGVPNTAIVITDGVSNIDARQTIPQAEVRLWYLYCMSTSFVYTLTYSRRWVNGSRCCRSIKALIRSLTSINH